MKKPHIVDEARNLVETGYIGNVTVEDVIANIEAVIADPKFRAGMDAICDYTDASAVWNLAELDRLRKYVLKIRPLVGNTRWAVIFPKGKDTTTARIFIALHNAFDSQIKIKLFNNRHDAHAWLDEARVLG
ncbi:MAG: hypothetical protein AB1772_09140 [Candidatus Zixiibacteriota bacterium]